nr:EOG090X0A1W [Lepidurus arcticus]
MHGPERHVQAPHPDIAQRSKDGAQVCHHIAVPILRSQTEAINTNTGLKINCFFPVHLPNLDFPSCDATTEMSRMGIRNNVSSMMSFDVAAQQVQDEELVRSALAKIYEIRAIRNERRINARLAGNKETIRRGALMKMLQTSAQTLPLWVSPVGEEAPSLCGCIPADHSYIAKVGDMVAALVRSSDGDENWILAEVVTYLSGSGRYEVDDIDEEQKERHALSRRRVIPLPLYRANPETDSKALFSKGATVMALYPQTTCFYKAVVNALPANHTEEYQVLFEDSSYADGFSPPLMVAQRYVIALKDKKAKL